MSISAALTTVACLQFEPVVGAKAHNIALGLKHIEAAAARGAQLIVLPELANSGYMFATRAEAFAQAEPVPGGPTCEAWMAAAARLGVTLVAGVAERDGEVLYNAAVVIGPSGWIGTFRKVHLWNAENLFFEPGNLGFPVFKTPLGRVGVAICYDIWFPEVMRTLSSMGAEVLLHPTLTSTTDRAAENAIARATAAQFQCYVVDVNGLDGGGNGRSVVADPAGNLA